MHSSAASSAVTRRGSAVSGRVARGSPRQKSDAELKDQTNKTWSFVVKDQINGAAGNSRIVGAAPLRNGTNATVIDVDTDRGIASLRLADGAEVQLDQRQLEQAEIRLAYVQHPFPAQGMTADTAHLILSTHATRDGTYVALTRAREETHIYAENSVGSDRHGDRLQALAERIGRSEPDVPSIAIPLMRTS